jgi:predicted Holliday junction resolvase-like endonuclease
MSWLPTIVMGLLFVSSVVYIHRVINGKFRTLQQKIENQPLPKIELPPVNVDASVDTTEIRRDLEEMKRSIPEFVMQSLTGTANNQKGKLGEIIGYLQLKAEYDRIIPLGTIVDFLAIKFPSDENPGYIDLIDIKTGKSARLSPDQRRLRDIVNAKEINFKTIKIDSVDGLDNGSN